MTYPTCYHDGAIVELGQICVSPLDGGLLRGEGVFETILCVEARPRDVEAHLERLREGLKRIALPIPETDADLETAIETVARGTGTIARLRVTVTSGAPEHGPTRLIVADPYDPPSPTQYRSGVEAITARDLRLDSQRPLRSVKSTSYLVHRLVVHQAAAAGAFDALVLNEQGRVVESGRANVVFRIGEEWLTPSRSEGCLPGTVRRRLLEGGWIREGEIDRVALRAAGSAVFTNSLVGVLPISRLDGRPLRVGHDVTELRRRLPGPWSRP